MTDERPRFDLYAYWRTSATYRVRVAINLKGLAVRERQIDLDAGEQHGEAFRSINPLGAIPALIDHEEGDDPAPLTQSLAIVEFLDEIAPKPPLLPADPHGRARVRSLAAMLAADTHPFVTARVKNYLKEHAGFDDAAWRAWQTHWFATGLRAFEERLVRDGRTGTYCHGDSVTMADICLASIVVVMRVFGIEVHDLPNIERIMAACDANEAFAKADPRRQEGAPAG